MGTTNPGGSIPTNDDSLFTVVDFLSGTPQTVSTATSTILNMWNNPFRDDVGAWNPANPERITVPAGFRFCLPFFHLEFGIAGADGPCSGRIYINNAAPAGNYKTIALSGVLNTIVSTHVGNAAPFPLPCTPGDYFSVRVRQDSGFDNDINGSRGQYFGVQWFR